ncbi:MAG: cyclase family protein [Rhodobacteraceae bacterium]|nr:cyclase family protein [Paracoccaceae bacterium]
MIRVSLTMAVAAMLLCAPAFGQEEWTTSKWGPDDELGSANLITPESVLAASKLVKTGKTYPLGIVVDNSTPAFAPRSLSVTILQPNQIATSGLGPTNTTYNDDIFMGWLGIGSQIDGLGHIGVDHIYYNGFKDSEFAKADGLTKLGLEKVPPIVARGVLLDMTAHYGEEILKEGTAYTREDIIAVAEKQGVELREGDVVLFHSGWLNLLDGESPDPDRYVSVEPGLGKTGAEYLAEIGVLAVGADTWGLEAVPFEEGVGVFEVHQILLPKNGIYILENMDTRALAADEGWEFMFTLGFGRLKGAVQQIINPIAIR